MFWGEWEASLQRDVNQWKDGTINPAEKYHLTQLLRLFTQSDQIVGGSYVDVFLPYFKNNEIRMALLSIANRESTHMRAYALLNDTLGLPESDYRAFLDYEQMVAKADFMQFFMEAGTPQAMAFNVARTVMNEGMSLFSAFVQLLNYQRPEAGAKMMGMCEIVEWSVKDETKHVEIMANLFRVMCDEHPEIVTDEFKQSIYEMFRVSVSLEDALIDLSWPVSGLPSLTKDSLKQYNRFIADRRLTQLGLKPNFLIEVNPLPWVDHIISGDSQKNFFEGRVADYNSKGLEGNWGW
tara:strand:+ start:501 stop:1382 length:882 start_codon:yes stop_codon:yes gene_type:complete